MLIVSSVIVSPGAVGFVRFLTVILTARRAVFICGETEVIVPETMVPVKTNISGQSSRIMRRINSGQLKRQVRLCLKSRVRLRKTTALRTIF